MHHSRRCLIERVPRPAFPWPSGSFGGVAFPIFERRFFPDGVRLDLDLVGERRFRKGVIVLRYAVRG